MNTEPGYFDALKRSRKSALIDVEIQPSGAPKTIAEKAVERAKSEGLAKSAKARPKNSFESRDQVWAVFDRDEHDSFDMAIELCARNGVHIGRSNPCFEVWLILHEEEFHRPDDRHQVCRHLGLLRPEYDPNAAKTCDWPKLLERVEIAEQRASRQLLERAKEGDPFGRPSTTVGALVAAIRDAADASTPK
jgi:RloB-like protein